jgi:predicted DNA-binding antitoxin AbrB/MazE fold protein
MLKYKYSEVLMQKTIDAIYEDGVFKPVKKVTMREHAKLKLIVLKEDKTSALAAKQQSKALLSLSGIWESGDLNVSEEHDKYLYGSFDK